MIEEQFSTYDMPLDLATGFKQVLKSTFLEHPVMKVAGTCLVTLMGEFNEVYLALAIALGADLITGVLAALYQNQFHFYKLRSAVYKWLVYWLLIILAHQGSNISDYLRWMGECTAIFLFIVEYNSTAGNLNKLGFRAPTFEKLADMIAKFRSMK